MDKIENPGAVVAHGASDSVLADASDTTSNSDDAQLPSTAFLEHLTRTRPEPDASPSTPMVTAELFITECFVRDCPTMPQRAVTTLVRDMGNFYVWDGTRYVFIPEENIKSGLYLFLQYATFRNGKKDKDGKEIWAKFNPNTNRVNQVLDALKHIPKRPLTDAVPSWLDPLWNVPATDYVAFLNGRLYLPTYELEQHTPDFYNHNALPFDYDPHNRKVTEWLKFLNSIWPDNPDAIACLQEMFGYIVAGGTKLHKIMMIIGPRRSGKGTIGRVLNSLLGAENCCGPTLGSLSGDFGLAPLQGKSLATIPDARFAAGQKKVVEILLMVSGEDVVTINRKHKDPVSCILPTRFLIMSNELPALEDASSALSSRFVLLTMTNSFLGREDHDLLEKLIAELPGILNWALDGWKRLNKRKRFTMPSSSDSALQELEALGSPVATFADEFCEFDPSYQASCKHVYTIWKKWCEEEGRITGSASLFGRNFHAAFSEVKRVRGRSELEKRVWLYKGVRIRS
jgi:putative DNA primase/helicase